MSASSGSIEWHLNGTSGQLEAEILESIYTVISGRAQLLNCTARYSRAQKVKA